ncbi:MAG TPA: TetR/AcrR family transcriptional regulator [Thermoanaerobaculia bacterium]|nr:TetR/AcrR family transcriptional regulator [Thermoanaerobaculia bacterium]
MGRPPRISRDQILDAARSAFTARGFAATTLADIAEALDVTPAAILRHFDSKQALFSAAMSTRAIAVPPFALALAQLDPKNDPREVLRAFASRLIPFLSDIIRSAIAVQMHSTTLVVPFDPHDEEVPPRRVMRVLADFFSRAMKAGTMRRADPHALAMLFIGQLQSYVFFHQVLGVTPVYPLDEYIDALIALWSEGALSGGPRAEKTDRRPGHPRRSRGDAVVHAPAAATEAARPRRNARGADGERGVAGRRPRRPRPRR